MADAIHRFLDSAERSGELSGIPTGQYRLDILQASSVKTASGMRCDEFIGHRDAPLPPEQLPEQMFMEGEYEDDAE